MTPKPIKQVLSEANYAINLSEQTHDELIRRLQAAEERIRRMSTADSSWLEHQRAKETRKLVDDIINNVDAKAPIQAPDSNLNTNSGLGQLPDTNLGSNNVDLNIPGDGYNPYGFDTSRTDPRYNFTGRMPVSFHEPDTSNRLRF